MTLPVYQDHVGLWREKLSAWVPDRLFDAHIHLGVEQTVGRIAPDRRHEALTTFTQLELETANAYHRDLFAGKRVEGMFAFGFPLRENDLPRANDYIARCAVNDRRVVPFILADPHHVDRTIAEYEAHLSRGVRFLGVKPYYDLLGIDARNSVFACRDIDFTPEPLLAWMHDRGMMLMLHTSSIGVGDPRVRAFVERVVTCYERITLILAHMGRYTAEEQFSRFAATDLIDAPGVYLEMSSASSARVYREALAERSRWGRIVFGTDLPYGLITGTEHYSSTHGPVFVTRDTYAWSDPKLNDDLAEQRDRMTFNTYHTIDALRQACEDLRLDDAEAAALKRGIFRENAEHGILGRVRTMTNPQPEHVTPPC